MQKEREEDEHLHGNQPKYVTKGYKDHLKESNKWKAIEEARAAREAKEDVRKTGDLHGFYRNLLNNNVAFGGEDLGTSSHELSEDAKVCSHAQNHGCMCEDSTARKLIWFSITQISFSITTAQTNEETEGMPMSGARPGKAHSRRSQCRRGRCCGHCQFGQESHRRCR